MSADPALTTTDSAFRKRERARAELDAIGGLRDPRRSVASRPAALLVGQSVLEIVTKAAAAIEDDLDSLGTDGKTPALEAVSVKARTMLAEWLEVDVVESGIQHGIVEELAKRSGDPDVDVLVWLKGRTPLGIEQPIIPRGIFPLAENVVGAEVGMDPWGLGQGNYLSYHDYKTEVDDVIKEELELGRLDWAPS